MKIFRHRLSRQKGAAITEYVVVGLAIGGILLVPFMGGESVLDRTTDAMKKDHGSYKYAMSLTQLPVGFKPGAKPPPKNKIVSGTNQAGQGELPDFNTKE